MSLLLQLTTRGVDYQQRRPLATVSVGRPDDGPAPLPTPFGDPDTPFAVAMRRPQVADGGPPLEYGCFDLNGGLLEDLGLRARRQMRNIIYYRMAELFNVSRGDPWFSPGSKDWGRDVVPDEAAGNWAVVYSAACPLRGDIERALAPLIKQRDGHAIEIPQMNPAEFVDWISDQQQQNALPPYLMICDDLDNIPIEYQFILNASRVTGRMWHPDADRLAAYAQKVVDFERGGNGATKDVIATPADDAVTAGDLHRIVDPIGEHLDLSVLQGDAFDRTRLLDAAREARLLALYTHGLGLTQDEHAESPDLEGAFVLDTDAAGRDGLLGPGDLPDGPFVPGGVVFTPACLSGGTQGDSDFAGWIGWAALAPFLASPASLSPTVQALLHAAQGPLAVVAHFDISVAGGDKMENLAAPDWDIQMWTHYGLLRALQRGSNVGRATYRIRWAAGHYYAQAIYLFGQLRGHFPPVGAQAQRPVGQFIDSMNLFHVIATEMRNFVILGDPAVRLQKAAA